MANLIVYYSRKGQNYWNGSIVDLAKGNTERVAEFVQKAVGGDLFEIETVREYSKDYMTCTEEAKAELRESARPELKKYLDSIDSYDTIFVGYPNWWGTMPMGMYTFLEHYEKRYGCTPDMTLLKEFAERIPLVQYGDDRQRHDQQKSQQYLGGNIYFSFFEKQLSAEEQQTDPLYLQRHEDGECQYPVAEGHPARQLPVGGQRPIICFR